MQPSQQYACPNPACTHIFHAADLVGRPTVTCPGCRQTFQLYAPIPASAAPPAPPAAAPAPAAVAAPTAPRRRRQSGADLAMSLLMLLGTLGLFGTVMVMVFFGVYQRMKSSGIGGDGEPFVSEPFLYTFKLPPGNVWKRDDTLQVALQANAQRLVRADPPASFALGCRDSRGRNTTPEELVEEARARLTNHFQRLQDEEKPDTTIAGQPAKRLVFVGEHDEVAVAGEVLTLSRAGIDYWFFFWAPSDAFDQARASFDDIKGRFTFKQRTGKVDSSALKDFTGTGYTLTDTEGVWSEYADDMVKDFDDAADMALTGIDKAAKKDTFRRAQTFVLLLPPGGDPMDTAKKHILKMQKEKRGYDNAKFEDAPLKDAQAKMGDFAGGQVAGLKLVISDDLAFFVVLGVAELDGKLLVVQCQCPTRIRNNWESGFVRLIGSARASGIRGKAAE
jgi:hypothetical protein